MPSKIVTTHVNRFGGINPWIGKNNGMNNKIISKTTWLIDKMLKFPNFAKFTPKQPVEMQHIIPIIIPTTKS